MCKGSLPPPARGPRQRGQVGLWVFHVEMHYEWKNFLHVPQSYKDSVSFSISEKHITQSVSSLRSISLESVALFYILLFNLEVNWSSNNLYAFFEIVFLSLK